ncbi:hypothetical protein RB195_022980 [Necator americanus]|uniref:Tetratricopeptide repeat protein n=1 Tax=Necator americanus TaxID=51031 RepID=A0ABR1EJW6_NECAM
MEIVSTSERPFKAHHNISFLFQCLLQLCNNIGTCIDFKYLDIEPSCISLNNWAAVVAGGESYFIWHFFVPHKSACTRSDKSIVENRIHKLTEETVVKEEGRRKFCPDQITHSCMGNNFCILYCDSGVVYKVSLHDGSVENRYVFIPNIVKMELNSMCTRLATVDTTNLLQFFEIGENFVKKIHGLEVKEVADFQWDEDQEDSIAYLTKQKLTVLRGNEAEEGISCDGYICSFRGLVVRTVLLDNFLLYNASADKRFIVDSEIKSLRDAKHLLECLKIEEAVDFVRRNPHPRLWKLIAEVALSKVDVLIAEYAYAKMHDYSGLRFCKRVLDIQDPELKKAEIFVHLGKMTNAERVYLDQDRRDLAISVHKKTDEWLHVLRLMSSVPNSTSDKGRMEALVNVANYHRDRQRWKSAADHYELARTLENLMVCYIHLDDFSSLELLTKQLPNGHPILSAIAEFFASAGLCEQAVQSFLRNEQVTNALHVCVQLNNWDKAVSLSRTHNLQDVNGLMGKCVGEMNESSERTLVAVQLYRRAGRFIDGARIVYRMAEEERKKTARCLRLKKLYVLAALLIEDHYRQFNVEIAEKSAADLKTTTALEKLLEEDGNLSREDARMIPRVWKAAQAYHFFMLAQRQLFQGDYFAAMTTSFSLVELETYIDPIEIYTLIETSHS